MELEEAIQVVLAAGLSVSKPGFDNGYFTLSHDERDGLIIVHHWRFQTTRQRTFERWSDTRKEAIRTFLEIKEPVTL